MKVGRNDPCPCGSGKKYKHCCYAKDSVKHETPIPEDADAEEAAAAQDAAADDAAADDDDAADESAELHAHKKQTSRHKDRSRFHGETRGGNRGFNPRVTRGAQRGS